MWVKQSAQLHHLHKTSLTRKGGRSHHHPPPRKKKRKHKKLAFSTIFRYSSQATRARIFSVQTIFRMCFFDQTVWSCGYWAWGPFREQCYKESRNGRTCGLRLILNAERVEHRCKFCISVIRKIDRIKKMRRSIRRCQSTGRLPIMIEQTRMEITKMQHEVDLLLELHERSISSISGCLK